MISEANKRNLAFASDLNFEKRAGLLVGNVTRGGAFNYFGYMYDSTIAHGLGYIPLVRMQYSYNGVDYFDQLATWNDVTFGTWLAVVAYADATNVHLLGDKSGILYYRVALYPRSAA